MRSWLVAATVLVLASVRALASAPEVYTYRIHHSLHGDLGHHRMTVSREDDGRLVVRHESDIEVRLLSALMYYRNVEINEVWEGDQLITFESVVDDDGRIVRVEARQDTDGLVLTSEQGIIRASSGAVPQQPSFENAIARPAFFAVETGEVLEAEVAKVEPDVVEIGGTTLPATKYTLAGGRNDRIWFTTDGVWAKWELDRGGGVVTLTRE